MFFVRDTLERDFNTSKCTLFEFHMQKLERFKILLVDDSKPIRELDVKVMDILNIITR